LREQPVVNETAIRSEATQITGFIDALLLIESRISSADRDRANHLARHAQHLFRMIHAWNSWRESNDSLFAAADRDQRRQANEITVPWPARN
jgi:hypothetical protein